MAGSTSRPSYSSISQRDRVGSCRSYAPIGQGSSSGDERDRGVFSPVPRESNGANSTERDEHEGYETVHLAFLSAVPVWIRCDPFVEKSPGRSPGRFSSTDEPASPSELNSYFCQVWAAMTVAAKAQVHLHFPDLKRILFTLY